jgi:sterol desaturase/sphingolipid hydroxylase (fatty acid hydroxylase superfamily)
MGVYGAHRMHEAVPTIVAALALALFWVLEAVLPAVPSRGRVGGARVRHLLLAGVNALPAIALAIVLGVADAWASSRGFGLLGSLEIPLWAHTILAFLLLDFLQYACHVFMHKTPILWRLHAVHHHAEHMEATAAFRFHTIEVAIHGVITLAAVLLLGIHVHDVVIYNAIMLPAAMFHHSNIRLHPRVEPLLRWLIVTPRMHRVHHSRWQPETDSNYAAVLTIWDRLFGTLSADRGPEAINVGLDGFSPEHTRTLRGMLATPFSDARAELGQPAVEQAAGPPPAGKPATTPDQPRRSLRAATA